MLTQIIKENGNHIYQADPESTITEAAIQMKEKRVGALLVMDGDWITGILSERDILNKVVAEELDPSTVKVHEVMSRNVVVIKPSLSIREAMKVVTEKRVRHLPIISEKKIVGVISSGDLTRRIVAEDEGVITTLYDYIYGTYPG